MAGIKCAQGRVEQAGCGVTITCSLGPTEQEGPGEVLQGLPGVTWVIMLKLLTRVHLLKC